MFALQLFLHGEPCIRLVIVNILLVSSNVTVYWELFTWYGECSCNKCHFSALFHSRLDGLDLRGRVEDFIYVMCMLVRNAMLAKQVLAMKHAQASLSNSIVYDWQFTGPIIWHYCL